MGNYFITSTDTGVGKTTISLCLMKHFKAKGQTVTCMKPVSAGCQATAEGLRNDDAVQLLKESSINLPYTMVNPYAYEPPIAPHIAAQQAGQAIDTDNIKNLYDKISPQSDSVIVEGAGGWLVPINDSETMADIASSLGLPVILVVGMRLGCLNHGLLTAASIEDRGLKFKGWIANHIDKSMLQVQENIEALKLGIGAPFLGSVHYHENANQRQIDFSQAGQKEFS